MADKDILEADVSRSHGRVEELEKEKEECSLRHKTEVDVVAKSAIATYLLSPAFRQIDYVMRSKVIADIVASIRHLLRRERPELEWDTYVVWDAVIACGSFESDVNCDNALVAAAGGDEATSQGGGEV
ncbi:unnamed protein product [Linum trigynum]|uniref:Uncharacterized protein n=1 Tax=Linum trigynum TaxID=586398 RepID=A0AAV2GIP3_9ROSI